MTLFFRCDQHSQNIVVKLLLPLAVDCGSLGNPTNGAVDTSSGTTFMMTATYTCNTGYGVNGATTVTCAAGGNWSPDPPSCDGEKLLTLLNPVFISLCV